MRAGWWLAAVFPLAAGGAEAQKLGLASQFGDVVVTQLKTGETVGLKKLKGHGYALKNLSEVAVDLVVEVMPPLEGSLRPLYEQIPDASWVKVVPARLKLGPEEAGDGEVLIKVPDDPYWRDRHFQCALYAHTVQGSFMNVGIYDKLFFSTGPGPEARMAQGPRLDWVPGMLRLGKVRVDRPFESGSGRLQLKVRNVSDAARRVRVEGVAFGQERKPPKGYAAPADPAAVQFLEPTLELAAGQTREVPFRLVLAGEAAGRRLAYLVRAAPEAGGSEAFGHILVEGTAAAGAGKRGAKEAPRTR